MVVYLAAVVTHHEFTNSRADSRELHDSAGSPDINQQHTAQQHAPSSISNIPPRHRVKQSSKQGHTGAEPPKPPTSWPSPGCLPHHTHQATEARAYAPEGIWSNIIAAVGAGGKARAEGRASLDSDDSVQGAGTAPYAHPHPQPPG